MSDQDIYIGIRPVYVQHEGRTVLVSPKTTVRAGHPLLAAYPGLFQLLRVQYDVERKTETRPSAKTAKTETR